jgi:diguanylate cyclase (GGDEF)-like protein
MRGEDRASLVQRADTALYMSKQEGRNCSHYHDGHQTEAFGVAAARSGARHSVVKNSVVAPDVCTDAITGLPSRRVFVDELRRRLSESCRYQRSLAMMVVQLDDVSRGTPLSAEERMAMNAVVAEQARLVMRDADLVARFDEDQFAILLPSTTETDAIIPAQRLCECVSQSRSLPESAAHGQLTVSIGIAGLRDENDTVATIIQRVQEALWVAVKEGGNRVRFHDGSSVLHEALACPDPIPSA